MLDELKKLMKKHNAAVTLESDTVCGCTDHQSYRIELSWVDKSGNWQKCEFPYGFDESDLL